MYMVFAAASGCFPPFAGQPLGHVILSEGLRITWPKASSTTYDLGDEPFDPKVPPNYIVPLLCAFWLKYVLLLARVNECPPSL
jgi:hypothetical protein